MTKLSLCMIVKNEETSLAQCLESVQEVVNEIVILDTGSTDNTIQIAKEFGAKVSSFAWNNNFASARNEALKWVTGDWILVLDADERLSPQIIPQLQQLIEEKDNLVVNLIRQEIGATQSPYSLVSRLFRRHPQLQFSRPYHALIDDSVSQILKQEPHWKIVDLPEIAIQHYGYHPEAITALNKSQRAQEAMESFLKDNPNDPYVCSKLGALYVSFGQIKQGIKLLRTGLKSNKAETNLLYEIHYHLGNAYAHQNQSEQAIKHYQKAIDQPILPALKLGSYNNLGSIFQATKEWQLAHQLYSITIKIDPNFAMGYYNLGMNLRARNQLQEAISAYKKAIELNPNYAPAYQNLGVIFLKLGYVSNSIEAFKKAIEIHEKENPKEAERIKSELTAMGLL